MSWSDENVSGPLPLPPTKESQQLFGVRSRKIILSLQPLKEQTKNLKASASSSEILSASASSASTTTSPIATTKKDDAKSLQSSLSSLSPLKHHLPNHTGPVCLMWDVESCNPSMGPVLAIGAVLSTGQGPNHRILHRMLWVFPHDVKTYDVSGRQFWQRSDVAPITQFLSDHYDEHPYTEADLVKNLRLYLDTCWRMYPQLVMMVDDPVTDCAMMCDLLWKYQCKPPNVDEKGVYRGQIYNSRDLMRGMFAAIDPKFQNLQEANLYGVISSEWKRFTPTPNVWTGEPEWNPKEDGPYLKHSPLYDAQHELTMYFQCVDLLRWHQNHVQQKHDLLVTMWSMLPPQQQQLWLTMFLPHQRDTLQSVVPLPHIGLQQQQQHEQPLQWPYSTKKKLAVFAPTINNHSFPMAAAAANSTNAAAARNTSSALYYTNHGGHVQQHDFPFMPNYY